MSRITRDRRPARSVTRTEIVPALVPGGTRATHPVGERRSFVASAPLDQRKLTRIPTLKPVPRSCTCLPIMTCGRGWQTARVAGTHRIPVSFGGRVRAWAAVGASAPITRVAIVSVRPCCILRDNQSHAAKSRASEKRAGRRHPLSATNLARTGSAGSGSRWTVIDLARLAASGAVRVSSRGTPRDARTPRHISIPRGAGKIALRTELSDAPTTVATRDRR
jgi:hypothetical protein